MLFLDGDDEVLRRRFTETRRRHPLAPDRPVVDGIARRARPVLAVRDRADLVIDTSALAQARAAPGRAASASRRCAAGLAVSVVSFAYRHGLPREADLVFDVRFLANPHYVPELQPPHGPRRGGRRATSSAIRGFRAVLRRA